MSGPNLTEAVAALTAQNAELARQLHALAADTNQGWVLITGTLIFFMQAGFAMLEAGSIRGRSTALIILKNLGDTVVGFLAWFLVGYAFAFGDESNSFLGFDKFALAEINRDVDYGYFFFQGCFASAAVTIVSGCLVERVRYRPYFLFSFLFNCIIYPFVAHWVWAEKGWLRERGFVDFAGSGVVHVTGGVAGLVGTIIVGPRLGFLDVNGNPVPLRGHSLPLAALGTFILWFGWFGFNGGSTLALSDGNSVRSAKVMTNTMLGGVSGALSSSLVFELRHGKIDVVATLNGLLAGLVSITAGCGDVKPWAAVVTGLVGGPVYLLFTHLLLRFHVDDPIGAVAVHFGAGAWGLVAVGLFHHTRGVVYGGIDQLGEQLLGLLCIFAWSLVLSALVYLAIKATLGFRVTPQQEKSGLDEEVWGWAYPEHVGLQKLVEESGDFEMMISNKHSRMLWAYRVFLEYELSGENLDFLLAVHDFQAFINDALAHSEKLQARGAYDANLRKVIRTRAEAIFALYVRLGAERQINVSGAIVDAISKRIKLGRYSSGVFDIAMGEVTTMLRGGSFARFLAQLVEQGFDRDAVAKKPYCSVDERGRVRWRKKFNLKGDHKYEGNEIFNDDALRRHVAALTQPTSGSSPGDTSDNQSAEGGSGQAGSGPNSLKSSPQLSPRNAAHRGRIGSRSMDAALPSASPAAAPAAHRATDSAASSQGLRVTVESSGEAVRPSSSMEEKPEESAGDSDDEMDREALSALRSKLQPLAVVSSSSRREQVREALAEEAKEDASEK